MLQDIFQPGFAAFELKALEIFRFQYKENQVYRDFCDALHTNPAMVNRLEQVPFLPIQFFKSREVTSTAFTPEMVFESSGTTGSLNSKHFVKDLSIYRESFLRAFTLFYGDPGKYCIIGLLPSYLERERASLVYMVNELIQRSGNSKGGFYLYEHDKLAATLLANERVKQPTLLIGVTYALLEFSEKFPMQLQHTIVMETGGMKGRGKELTRAEVHKILKQRLGITEVHSEYGMTELLSQAWSKANGIFSCPPWMKVLLRAEDDPFEIMAPGSMLPGNFSTGAVNIIDLANLYSCSFIATDDMGKLYPGGSFEIMGRLDHCDTRGCGLMIL